MLIKGPAVNNSYAIDFIFGKVKDRKTRQIKYAVKWDNFPLEDFSWEPSDHFFNGMENTV
jgi:hypothetical protein